MFLRFLFWLLEPDTIKAVHGEGTSSWDPCIEFIQEEEAIVHGRLCRLSKSSLPLCGNIALKSFYGLGIFDGT